MESLTYVTTLVLLVCLPSVVSGIPTYYMSNYCGQSLNMSYYGTETGRLQLTSLSSYQPMTCTLTIVAPTTNKRIMLYFNKVNIKYTMRCSDDSLQLFDGPSIFSPRLSGLSYNICGYNKSGGVYTTTSNTLTLLFTSISGSFLNSGFDLVFTAYHSGKCYKNEYGCSNGRCVASYLTCNGYNPCGDYSDCRHISGGAIAGIVIGAIVFIAILIAVAFIIKKKRVI